MPTWIRNELKDGIPVFKVEVEEEDEQSNSVPDDKPVYIDSGNVSDDENSNGNNIASLETLKKPPFQFARGRSYDTLSRRTSFTQQSRDPNFNIIPKLKKQQTPVLHKLNETQLSETQIINGVAVTTSIATIDNVKNLKGTSKKVGLVCCQV